MIRTPFLRLTDDCNLRCEHCTRPETEVQTDKGIKTIEEVVQEIELNNKEIKTLTHKGEYKEITNTVNHQYNDELVKITPRHYQPLEVTTQHKVYTDKGMIEAHNLNKNHKLFIPKIKEPQNPTEQLNTYEILNQKPTIKTNTKHNKEKLQKIKTLTNQGKTGYQIAQEIDYHPSYIRKVRGQINNQGLEQLTTNTINLQKQAGQVRYKGGRTTIPQEIQITNNLMKVFGYYLAEGNIYQDKNRPNSKALRFTFGPEEKEMAQETKQILQETFNIKPRITNEKTTKRVIANSTILAELFQQLFNKGSKNKKIPKEIKQTTNENLKHLLKGYMKGDGCKTTKNVDRATTISKGIVETLKYIAQRLNKPIRTRKYTIPDSEINKRKIHTENYRYEVDISHNPNYIEKTEKGIWTPIRKIETKQYKGIVYDIEVKNHHTFTPNQITTSNCYAASGVSNPDELNPDQWIQALQKIAQYNNDRVVLLGGEPTILPHLRYILEKACKMFKQVSLQTNGTIIPYRTLEHLESEFGGPPSNLEIAISIEGREELHNKIRGIGMLSETWESLKKYRDKEYNVGVRVTVTKYIDPDSIEQMVKRFNKKEIPVTLVRFLEKGRGTKEWTPSKELLAKLYIKTKNLQDEGYTVDMFDSPYYAWDEDKREKYGKYFKDRGICESMRGERMNVEPDGTVTPCFMLTDDEHEIGNILTTPMKEIESNLLEYAEKEREKQLIEDPCQNCEYSELCQGGCAYLNSEDKRLDNRCPIPTLGGELNGSNR